MHAKRANHHAKVLQASTVDHLNTLLAHRHIVGIIHHTRLVGSHRLRLHGSHHRRLLYHGCGLGHLLGFLSLSLVVSLSVSTLARFATGESHSEAQACA